MKHEIGSRSERYRKTLAERSSPPETMRPVRHIAVPPGGGASVRPAPVRGSDWLEIFEIELEMALADYAGYRADGLDTRELADYIAYLAACVACLEAEPNADESALASLGGAARRR